MRSGGNILGEPTPKTLLISCPSCRKLLASCGSSARNKKPAGSRAAGLRVLPLLLRAGYKPPPASCFGQHGLIPTVVIRMHEGIREV